MIQRLQLLKTKAQLSLKASSNVLKSPKYLLFAAIVALLFIQLLYWLLNASLFWYFFTARSLNIIEKMDIFSSIIVSYLSSLPLWQAFAVVSLAITQGVVISVLLFTVRNNQSVDKKAVGGTGIASIIAMLSVGCVSCGTSIVAPIIGLFVSGATASLSEAINKIAIVVGLIIALYALYAVGLTAANIQAKQKSTSTTS
ncbi:MAG TPA: hypothetical protein PLJ04_01665 [Candidatus Saccharibacteria bacterium]|nr:hypothetical protein [Candidatus Nomurabacteria bacterium]HPR10267.1 hypothetical protein [Candidatus Saccharibacteria bacterium]